MEYAYGSAWRRWDLHIHAPTSAFNNQFEGTTNDEKWSNYLTAIEQLPSEIKVIGVTDYCSIDGFARLLQYKNQGRISNIDFILPNVEFRLDLSTQKDRPVNLHILFNPTEEVLSIIESHFFNRLRFEYGGNPYTCSRNDLIRLGKKFRNDSLISEQEAYAVGVKQFKTQFTTLRKILAEDSILRANSLIGIVNGSVDGASGIRDDAMQATRNEIYRFGDFIFSGNPTDCKFFLGEGSVTSELLVRNYGSLKPCLHGSDAHDCAKVGLPDLDRLTWIKSDPTFRGLQQAIFEPNSRVYIGLKPPKLTIIEENKTKYVQSIKFRKAASSRKVKDWFDGQKVELNHNLVAIIGKKGSGKSALADAIALAGNFHDEASFSFLSKEKFRNPKSSFAEHFEIDVIWEDGETYTKKLSEHCDKNRSERVRYIPQAFFEKICSSLDSDALFQTELEKVIFTYIDESSRLGTNNLQDLTELNASETQRRIDRLRGRLTDINRQISILDKQIKPDFRIQIENQIAQYQRELIVLEEAKPQKNEDPPIAVNELNLKNVEECKTKIADLNQSLVSNGAHAATTTRQNISLIKIRQRLLGLESSAEELRVFVKQESDQNELKLDVASIVKVDLDSLAIEALIAESNRRLATLKSDQQGIEQKINELKAQLPSLNALLTEPQRKQQEYDRLLSNWIIKRDGVISTIASSKEQITLLDSLPDQKRNFETERKLISSDIYQELASRVALYKTFYKPVQEFTEKHQPLRDQFPLSFEASIHQVGFSESFLALIARNRGGTFYGPEGENILKEVLSKADFSTLEGALSFVDQILRFLEEDQNQDPPCKMDIDLQLRQDVKREDIYDCIYSFKYLLPKYELVLGGRGMKQLSPGERGALLLVFYLLLDKGDNPLIIDQPEENLDNETIFHLLVPCIKEAKERRQVIVVTHNPNLAVVCDAEQIISCTIDKPGGFKVSYACGAIENPIINDTLVRILEGTRPAFENRSLKYLMRGKASPKDSV